MASCKVRGAFIKPAYATCSRVSSIYLPRYHDDCKGSRGEGVPRFQRRDDAACGAWESGVNLDDVNRRQIPASASHVSAIAANTLSPRNNAMRKYTDAISPALPQTPSGIFSRFVQIRSSGIKRTTV